jgi:hypothetical protein
VTLLATVQIACDRLGLPRPNAVMTSGDDTIRIMRALATQEGRELAARATWQKLTKEQSFTTTATMIQTGALPADFDRFINGTVWNYTQKNPMLGPLEPDEWQQFSAGLVGPPDLYFRMRGNDFLILPTPPAGEEIRFEYVSAFWVDTDADGVGEASAWAADTNSALLDEELIALGIVWRFLKRNKLPFADEFGEYTALVNQAIGRDGARRVVNIAGRASDARRMARVPDGSWNLT